MNSREYNPQYVQLQNSRDPNYLPPPGAGATIGKNPNLGHFGHYVPTAATQPPSQYHNIPPREPPMARFTYEADGTVQQLVEVKEIHIILHENSLNFFSNKINTYLVPTYFEKHVPLLGHAMYFMSGNFEPY